VTVGVSFCVTVSPVSWNQLIELGKYVGANIRISPFVDRDPSRGVGDINHTNPILHAGSR